MQSAPMVRTSLAPFKPTFHNPILASERSLRISLSPPAKIELLTMAAEFDAKAERRDVELEEYGAKLDQGSPD